MARRDDPPPAPERTRMRFVLLDLDGTTNDIQTLAQSIVQAVKSNQPIMAPARPVQALPPTAPTNGVKPTVVAPTLFDGVNEEDEPEAEGVEVVVPTAPPTLQNGSNGPKNGSKKKMRTPQLVSTLEFTSGEKTLTDYLNEVKPGGNSKRYLAITQWLHKYRGIAEVSGDHIYTAFRFLEMNVPKDVLSVFRALKAQEWVEPGKETGTFKVTHIGENQLNKAKGK
jgi:hypothetical protein